MATDFSRTACELLVKNGITNAYADLVNYRCVSFREFIQWVITEKNPRNMRFFDYVKDYYFEALSPANREKVAKYLSAMEIEHIILSDGMVLHKVK
jgi:hypothetical protein